MHSALMPNEPGLTLSPLTERAACPHLPQPRFSRLQSETPYCVCASRW